MTTATATMRTAVASFMPSSPTFDLTTEPWIDIVDVHGTQRTVSLRTLLSKAHEVRLDEAKHGLLWEHAMTRLLVVLGYLLRHHTPGHDWDAVAAGGHPLPSDAISATLERLGDRLWLLHPETPFLQHLPVLDLMDPKAKRSDDDTLDASTHPVWTLMPDVPSKTNTAWFGRADQRPALAFADLANAVLVRHVFAMPGNEQANWGAAGGRQATKPANRSEGGVTGLTHNGKALAHLVGPDLAATMVRNQLDTIVKRTSGTTFIDSPKPPGDLSSVDPLWWLLAAPATCVLIPAPHDPDGWRVIRTPMPWPSPVAKVVSTEAVRNDQFGLRVDAKTAASRTAPGFSQVIVSSAGSDLNAVRTFLKDRTVSESGLHAPTILDSHNAAVAVPGATRHATVAVIDGAGGATGPRIAGVSRFTPPVALDLPLDRARWWLNTINRVAYAQGAASRIVGRHSHLTMCGVVGDVPDRLPPPPDGWYARCDEQMVHRSEAALLDLLETAASSQPLPALAGRHQDAIATAALELFDELTAPLAGRPAIAAARARQRRVVHHRIHRLWETP